MFAGFRLDINEDFEVSGKDIVNYEEFCKGYKTEIRKGLEHYINGNALNASKIITDWFPEIKADVFLSHSHQDKNRVVCFASWLYSLGINAFIDSEVWNYCDDLLRKIDEKYCILYGSTFNYRKRNQSTSHVHILLNTALIRMIDKAECFIFIGSTHSMNMNPSEIETETYSTYSPWIYSEISTSEMIRQKIPSRLEGMVISLTETAMLPLTIEYDIELNHLYGLSIDDIKELEQKNLKSKDALDALYRKKKIIS